MPEPELKVSAANSERVQTLLDRIELNYGRLGERLDELEELVPNVLEQVQASIPQKSPSEKSSGKKSIASRKPK
jgi:hypothetical protein